MLASLSTGAWEAISAIVVAALAVGSIIGNRVTKYLRTASDRRELDGEIRTAFRGTGKNPLTGEAGSPPLLVQMVALTQAVSHLTDRVDGVEGEVRALKTAGRGA